LKVKYADRSHWNRVEERSFSVHHENNDRFQGTLAILRIHQVRTRLVVPYGESNLCIADDGYVWVQHFPSGEHFTVTAMLDGEGQIVQWYIDIIHAYGETEEGVPWYEDLYLDVVAFPNGEYFSMDEDELEEALQEGEINKEQYDLAWRTHQKVVRLLESGELDLLYEAEKWVKNDES